MNLKELIKINKRFEPESNLKNPSSLEFAIIRAELTSDWKKQLAYLIRAVVVDHAFDGGNKRTGVYLIFKFFEENNLAVDQQKVDRMIIKIASENITDIGKIKRLIENETI